MSMCRKGLTSTSAESPSSATGETGAATPTARTPRPFTSAYSALPGQSTYGGCRAICTAAATATSSASLKTISASFPSEMASTGARPIAGHSASWWVVAYRSLSGGSALDCEGDAVPHLRAAVERGGGPNVQLEFRQPGQLHHGRGPHVNEVGLPQCEFRRACLA